MAADFTTIAVVAMYFLAMLGIGAWASKKIKNTEDYLVAGRSLGFWVFILLMIGTVASGHVPSRGLGARVQGRLAHDLGADIRPALNRVLYHLLWRETPQRGKDCRLHYGAGLPCPPV